MNLDNLLNNLLKEGKLKRQDTDINYLNSLLEAAKRNFGAAALVKNKIDEAAFKLVYDGLLQIGRVILLINGYRPDDGEQHKTTFSVAGELLGEEYRDLIDKIQKFRIKRNDCIYEPKGLIGRAETKAIFETAGRFWKKVRVYLENKNPQLKLFKDFSQGV
jgi:hypothetical protein